MRHDASPVTIDRNTLISVNVVAGKFFVVYIWQKVFWAPHVRFKSRSYLYINIKALALLPLGGALCARWLLNAIFLQVSVEDHGLKLYDF